MGWFLKRGPTFGGPWYTMRGSNNKTLEINRYPLYSYGFFILKKHAPLAKISYFVGGVAQLTVALSLILKVSGSILV